MYKSSQFRNALILFILILFVSLACAFPGMDSTADHSLEQTQIALGVEQTAWVMQQTANAGAPTVQAEIPTAEGQVAEAPTYTPFPTYTPYPTEEVTQDTSTPEPSPTTQPAMSMEDRIRGSNVLIYEDIVAEPSLAGNRRVNDAVNQIGFSGGKVINVGDAMGTFKSHLLSGTQWDLIIISAEARSSIQGEFWEYMIDHLNRNTAMIAEVWYLDSTAYGKIAPVMSKCGIAFQSNWDRPINYDVLDYSILTLATDHPVFNTPNSGVSLVTPNIYWMFDAGDLIKLGTGGDAQMLAGIYYSHKSDYGVLAECMGGRVIFQTFSTHDYRYDQTVPLWVNYIQYTLTNHYQALDQQ